MPATQDRVHEWARWRTPDGSAGNWSSDRLVRIRSGALGPWTPIGKAWSRLEALRLLRQRRDGWQLIGAIHERSLAGGGSSRSRKVPREVQIRPMELVSAFGLLMRLQENSTHELRLARVAAYARRCKEMTLSNRNPKGSLFDSPLTFDEILSALVDPEAPLSDPERQAAIEAIGDGEQHESGNQDEDASEDG